MADFDVRIASALTFRVEDVANEIEALEAVADLLADGDEGIIVPAQPVGWDGEDAE